MKFSTKILILSLSLFSFEAYSKAINFYCKSKFGGDAGVAWDVYIDMQQSNASIYPWRGKPVNRRLNIGSNQVWFEIDKHFTFYISRETLNFKLYNTSGGFDAVSEKGICHVMKNNNKF